MSEDRTIIYRCRVGNRVRSFEWESFPRREPKLAREGCGHLGRLIGSHLGRLIGSPDGKPHFTLARCTGVDANSCVSTCRKFVDACDIHIFAALAYWRFGTARRQ
jgi:hypothetical protein